MPEMATFEVLADRLMRQGAQGVAIATRDGMPVIDRLPGAAFGESVCAMTAAALAACETAFQECRAGAVDRLWIEGTQHLGLVAALDDRTLVAICLPLDADRAAVMASIDESLETLRPRAG